MSVDKSLKVKSGLKRHRNVLSRGEKIIKLKVEERWEEGKAIGLPKVSNRKTITGKKTKKKEE